MTAIVAPETGLAPGRIGAAVREYGRFEADGREFAITDWRTPRPWVNLIANPRFGLAVSHTGAGFTWIDNSQLAVITRWQQDLTQDNTGKFLYLRDVDSGGLWSLSPAPVWPDFEHYECRHGLGFTTFVTQVAGIRAEWTLFAHARDTAEIWRVELRNTSDRLRRLEICGYLEWNCGVSPSPRREFHKLFIETEFDPARRSIFARNHMWDVPARNHGHWNADFPYVSAFATTEPVLSAQGDQAAFLGRYGSLRAPAALELDTWRPRFGRFEDAIAAMRSAIELKPGQGRTIGYVLAVGDSREAASRLAGSLLRSDAIEAALADARKTWTELLATHRVETPEPTLNFLTNDWIRYQAISGRIWGRAGYYQQSGAFGFRDQLQDSQVWLTIDPGRCREQLNLHALHQFADGSVYHWWHPLTEQGLVTTMTDDLLWLGFVAANYIRETGDLTVLADATPFLNEATPTALIEHIMRAFRRVFSRTSPRGLPYIGAGDWNDGLSACGLQERGESIWLGHFLVGLLADWSQIFRRAAAGGFRVQGPGFTGDWLTLAAEFEQRRDKLIAAINEHGWDGEWYWRATLDSGEKIGSKSCRVGRIFLNAQTWAILNDVAPPDRARQCWESVKTHLIREAGALLLAPAYDKPIKEIGYITRYAPGLRENGGVYTHAATWAIAAACRMRDHETVARLLTAINPALKDSERYWAEPYVLPGNVDGPESPYFGRGGWTWYTGSAQWLHRIVTHWVLGVRPEWDSLCVDPVLPPTWRQASMTRPWRGVIHQFELLRDAAVATGDVELTIDGKKQSDRRIAMPSASSTPRRVIARIH